MAGILSRRAILSAIVLGGALAGATGSWAQTAGGDEKAAGVSAETVRLVIDYGNGAEKQFTRVPWRKDLTVLDAMTAAKAIKPGLDFKHKGSGKDAFLQEIDGVGNEGSGQDKKNWLFWVCRSSAGVTLGCKFSDKSFGVYTLQPSDIVVWRFDTWPQN